MTKLTTALIMLVLAGYGFACFQLGALAERREPQYTVVQGVCQ